MINAGLRLDGNLTVTGGIPEALVGSLEGAFEGATDQKRGPHASGAAIIGRRPPRAEGGHLTWNDQKRK